MSRYTYKNEERSGSTLVIDDSDDKDTAYINTSHYGVSIPRNEAPAAALALLETAGWEVGAKTAFGSVQWAVTVFGNAVREEAESKAKAEDEARLNAEALKLFNSVRDDRHANELTGHALEFWREVALKARELHGKGAGE